MPIARSAAYSQRSGLSASSISYNGSQQRRRTSNTDRHDNSSSDDFFTENPTTHSIPTSIKGVLSQNEYSRQPSALKDSTQWDGGEEEEHISCFAWIRIKCGQIVDDERVQMFILLLIAINSIMFGVATFPAVKNNPDLVSTFDVVDLIILVIFTFESVLQFIFNGCRRFFKDGWLIFDLVIVIISWISVEIDELRALRIFRALRFVTRVSILRNVVVALFSILPAITAIFTLLLLIFYIYAVMFTQLFKDFYELGYTPENYFGRMDYTMFTLFQILCMDEWGGIAEGVVAVDYWAWAVFITFIIMSAFVVVNLLIAVICDALQILRTAEAAVVQKMHGSYLEHDEAAIVNNLNGTYVDDYEGIEVNSNGIIDGVEARAVAAVGNNNHQSEQEEEEQEEAMSKERVEQRVNEMEKMLDEMLVSQQAMARTIECLQLVLHGDRKHEKSLQSITEGIDEVYFSDSLNAGNPQQ